MSESLQSPDRNNVFDAYVPVPAEEETRIGQAMDTFADLGQQFASLMQGRRMPIDVARVGEDTITDIESGWVRCGRRLPIWLVLSGTDLSGNSLFKGTVSDDSRTSPYSEFTLGDQVTYDDKFAFEQGAYAATDGAGIWAHESAIGLTATAEYVRLSKQVQKSPHKVEFYGLPDTFTVDNQKIKPSDFFSLKARITAEVLGDTMKGRMVSAIDSYSIILTKERELSEMGGAVLRSIDYYDLREGELERYKNPTSITTVSKLRKWFGKA